MSDALVALTVAVFLLNSIGLIVIAVLTPYITLHVIGAMVYLLCISVLVWLLRMMGGQP